MNEFSMDGRRSTFAEVWALNCPNPSRFDILRSISRPATTKLASVCPPGERQTTCSRASCKPKVLSQINGSKNEQLAAVYLGSWLIVSVEPTEFHAAKTFICRACVNTTASWKWKGFRVKLCRCTFCATIIGLGSKWTGFRGAAASKQHISQTRM